MGSISEFHLLSSYLDSEASEELAALSAHLVKVEEEVWYVAFCLDLTLQSFSSRV